MRLQSLATTVFCALMVILLAAPNFLQVPFAGAVNAPPSCHGKNATLYVQNGKIVGGNHDGDTYTGTLHGSNGDDVIVGTSGADVIDGGNGNDTICGAGGNDDITGDNGNDYLCGNAGNDELKGDGGNDILCGEEGDDDISGGSGNDKLDGGDGSDVLDGGSNTDICWSGTMDDCESNVDVTECAANSGSATSSSSSAQSSVASSVVSSSSSSNSVSSQAASSAAQSSAVSSAGASSSVQSSVASSAAQSSAQSSTAQSSSVASSDGSSSSASSCPFVIELPDFEFPIPEIPGFEGCFSSSSSSSSNSSAQSSVSSAASSGSSASSVSSQTSSASQSSAISATGGGNEGTSSQDTSAQDGGNQDNNGGRRGQNTNVLGRIVRALGQRLGLGGTTPPPAFGGGNTVPLSDGEIQYLCSVQRALPVNASPAIVRFVSRSIAEQMGRDPAFVMDQLLQPDLCADILASLRPGTLVANETAVTAVTVNERGFPVSSNPTWNACFEAIHGTRSLTLQEIRQNPDKDKDGTPRDCAYYHESAMNLWYMPDFRVYFTYDPKTGALNFPEGYAPYSRATVASK